MTIKCNLDELVFNKKDDNINWWEIPIELNSKIINSINLRNWITLESIEKFKSLVFELTNWSILRKKALFKILKKNLHNITVPWIINKEWNLINTTNYEYKTALFLLKKFWFYKNKNDLQYIERWLDLEKNQLWLWITDWKSLTISDFWNENSDFSFENLWVWLISESRDTHSLAHTVYLYINELLKIDDIDLNQLERFINFVDLSTVFKDDIYMSNDSDNFNLYNNSYRMLFGLAKYMNIDDLYKYFADEWKTWFEILSNNELWKYWLLEISNKRFNSIWDSKNDFENRDEKNSLFYWDLEFILDINSNIENCLEICTSKWKWVIKVANNWDIIVNKPINSWNWSNILVYKRSDKNNYIKKIKWLLSILEWDSAKYFLLRRIGYRWNLYKSLTPDRQIWSDYENKKIEEERKIRRRARMDMKEFHFDHQNLVKEDIYLWSTLYAKIDYLIPWKQTIIDINIENSDEYLFYTTYKSVKNWAQFNIERWESCSDYYKFKIISISDINDRWYKYKVKLKQI